MTSKQTLDVIKKFEGVVLKGYLDSANLLTVGCGHLVKKGESYRLGQSITLEESDRLLNQDLRWAENAVSECVAVPINENQRTALVSLCFNIGERAFKRSTLVKKLNARDYKGSAKAFLSWVYANGKASKGLMNRRVKEKALFEKV